MLNPQRLLGQLLSGGLSRRRYGSGGKAMLGLGALGVAFAAYEHFSNQKSTQATPADGPPPPPPADRESDSEKAILLIQTMIAAAHADGMVDAQEQSRILERCQSAGLSQAEQALLKAEIQNPVDLDSLCSAAQHFRIEGQVYAAALLAVDIDNSKEETFLNEMANTLGLSTDRVIKIRRKLQG